MAGVFCVLALVLSLPGWAAGVRAVPRAARSSPLLASPFGLARPALGPGLNLKSSKIGLATTLPGALPTPWVGARPQQPVAVEPIAADAPLALPSRADNALQPSLERLEAAIPEAVSAESDLETRKYRADRSFDFKSETRGADVEPQRLGGPGASANADDGGGPDYPRREITYHGHTFHSVEFRPNIPVEAKIIEAIDASQSAIRIALYEFKLRGVLEALLRARQRGVKVEIILDYSNVFPENDPEAEYRARRSNEIWGLIREGFDFLVLRGVSPYGIMHNKFAIFDDELAEFGSYNWSFSAEKSHYENANFSTDQALVADLSDYWDYLRRQSAPFAQAKDHAWPKTAPPPPKSRTAVVFNDARLPAGIFMPNGADFEDAVVTAVDAAESSVDAAMFALRSTRIAQALARARRRGLSVRFIMDEGQSQSEYFSAYASWLAQQGIEIRVLGGPDPDSEYPKAQKMHHKFMVLDGKLVETGSPNWTKRASMDNYENARFLDDPIDAAGYAFAFSHMFSVARTYSPPALPADLPTDDELADDILHPSLPDPNPPPPEPSPLPPPGAVAFHDENFPSSALLPNDPIEPLLVRAIDASQKSIRLALYEFTSEPILEALRRARDRGLKIELVLDRGHLYTSGIDHEGHPRKPKPQVVALAKEGFDMKILRGRSSGVMHNKYLVFDDEMVVFGSYNLTKVTEEHHFENVIFSGDSRRIDYYNRYFAYMRALANDIDFDKLDDILNRVSDSGTESDDEPSQPEPEAADPQAAFPPPPEDPARPIDLNGEAFPLELFSPLGRIEETLIRAIKAAKFSIDIAMFSFYSQKIAEALLTAKAADPELKIRLVFDYSQSRLEKLDAWFVDHGFDLRLLAGPNGPEGDPMFEKMHNKFMLIDGKLLETGSFNYSPNAQNNSFENANFIDDLVELARYAAYFERLWLLGWEAPPATRKPSQARPSLANPSALQV
ncbi:MAG TPA: hypothetical protein DEB40_06370 [Elusimicrobia bacterium]|nr:hypothetical protein [Elusimicrobiota bacterium]HBT61351.1 hypothetical protein [Elusimicrobiota bacterium]